MKEIMAIIRPKKVSKTKDVLDKLGYPAFTAVSVMGRGKQRGIAGEVNCELPANATESPVKGCTPDTQLAPVLQLLSLPLPFQTSPATVTVTVMFEETASNCVSVAVTVKV